MIIIRTSMRDGRLSIAWQTLNLRLAVSTWLKPSLELKITVGALPGTSVQILKTIAAGEAIVVC